MTRATRSHAITWKDPAPLALAARPLRGLDRLHAIGQGDFPMPPMPRTVGIEPVEMEEARAVLAAVSCEDERGTPNAPATGERIHFRPSAPEGKQP